MTTFAERIGPALVFEGVVIDWLRTRGWTAEPFGQGQLPSHVRDLLRDTDSTLRRLPDILACKRFAARTRSMLVDAKHGDRWRDTGNHAVEAAVAMIQAAMAEYMNTPIFYVFEDGRCTTPDRVLTLGVPGRTPNVFRTPFLMIRAERCEPVDAIFGPAQQPDK